jgi:hypothetical protein
MISRITVSSCDDRTTALTFVEPILVCTPRRVTIEHVYGKQMLRSERAGDPIEPDPDHIVRELTDADPRSTDDLMRLASLGSLVSFGERPGDIFHRRYRREISEPFREKRPAFETELCELDLLDFHPGMTVADAIQALGLKDRAGLETVRLFNGADIHAQDEWLSIARQLHPDDERLYEAALNFMLMTREELLLLPTETVMEVESRLAEEYELAEDIETLVPHTLLPLPVAAAAVEELQSLLRQWERFTARRPVADLWYRVPQIGEFRTITERDAWLRFATTLNELIEAEPIPGRAGITIDDEPPTIRHEISLPALWAGQLVDIIRNGWDMKRCAATGCAKPFIFQQGRPAKTQRRSADSKYCTAACAVAQANRDLRTRKRK